MRTLDEYVDLPYRISLTRDTDEGRVGWVAEVAELPGCMSQGDTPEDAVENVRDAMRGWISVMLEDGKAVPEPTVLRPSGRFLLRLPSSLHGRLVREAELEGVSLNHYVSSVLAGHVGSDNGDGDRARRADASSQKRRPQRA